MTPASPPDDAAEADDDEFVRLLLNAFIYPLTPEDIQVASEGYTCGFIPPAQGHLYALDEDWF